MNTSFTYMYIYINNQHIQCHLYMYMYMQHIDNIRGITSFTSGWQKARIVSAWAGAWVTAGQRSVVLKMPVSCCVYGCTQRGGRSSSTRFFRFPADAELRGKWETAVKRLNWKATAYTRICGRHFITGMYYCLDKLELHL